MERNNLLLHCAFRTWLSRGRNKVSAGEGVGLGPEPLLAPHAKSIEQNP